MIFAVIEGADAVGKHTQSERLRSKLASLGIDTTLISFPRYGTDIGQALLRHLKRKTLLIDVEKAANKIVDTPAAADSYLVCGDFTHADDPLAFQALMVMDKYDEAPAIVRSLRQGTAVVSDRWWHSALAYGTSDGLDDDMLIRIHEMLPKANVHVLLDLDPKIAAARRGKPRDRYEEDREKMERVRDRYRLIWERHAGQDDYAIVDASQAPDEVEAQIWCHIARAIDKAHAHEEVTSKIRTVPRKTAPLSFATWS